MLADTVVVIDAMNLCYRSWWPCRELKTQAGNHTGLEFGFIKNLLAVVRDNYPAQVVLAWDGIPKRALAINPEYKANRDHSNRSEEAPWLPRLERLRQTMSSLLESLYHEDLEADEQIARLVSEREAQNKQTIILSNDDDNDQLASALTTILTDVKADPAGRPDVIAKWGVPPDKMPMFRAIKGDSSDNLKGIPRIPTEIVIRLVTEARDIDHLLHLIDAVGYLSDTQRAKFKAGKEVIKTNHSIMNLRDQTQPPVSMPSATGDLTPVMGLCRELELTSLLSRKEWQLFKREAADAEAVHGHGSS